MTLGGLALAVGILVDDATVEIENIHRNLAHGKAARSARSSTARSRSPCRPSSPRSASASSSCRSSFITGAAQFLFMPLAMAVVFAMLASYLLSRTLVPTMVHYLLPAEAHLHAPGAEHTSPTRGRIWARPPGVQPPLRALPRRLSHELLAWALGAPAHRGRSSSSASSRCRSALFSLIGGLLPHGRRRASPPARPRPGRHADRGDRAALRRRRGGDPRDDPGRRDRHRARQHRHPGQRHQPGLQRRVADVGRRRRDPGRAQAEKHGSTADYVDAAAHDPRDALPRPDLLLPARRHRDADPELRAAGADRRADRRARIRQNLAIARGPGAADRRGPRRGRRAPAAGAAHAGVRRRRRPHAGAGRSGSPSATWRRACSSRSRARRRRAELLARTRRPA